MRTLFYARRDNLAQSLRIILNTMKTKNVVILWLGKFLLSNFREKMKENSRKTAYNRGNSELYKKSNRKIPTYSEYFHFVHIYVFFTSQEEFTNFIRLVSSKLQKFLLVFPRRRAW